MYLKLRVRTSNNFPDAYAWALLVHTPRVILWIAVLGTQIVATLIAVYGLFMTPLGWGWAMFVWGYAIAWALVNDRAKLVAYAILDKHQANTSTKVAPPKVTTPTDSVPPKAKDPANSIAPGATTATDSVKANTPTDMTPRIKERAYDIYEQRGHNKGQAGQDWAQAEREIRKDQAES